MAPSAAMVLAMSLSAVGGGGLALLVWRQGDTAVGAKPLAAFIAVVGLWAVGLVLPNRLGEALMALAPVGGAVFVHFAIRLARPGRVLKKRGGAWGAGQAPQLGAFGGRKPPDHGCVQFSGGFRPPTPPDPGHDRPRNPLFFIKGEVFWRLPLTKLAYGVGGLATAAALVAGAGRFVPWPGGMLFRYEGVGLLAGAVTAGLAAFGHCLLVEAWCRADRAGRRQITLVLVSSVVGLLSVTGLAFPLLGIERYPWPLLLQPLYLVGLAYAVLRYRLMAVNRWAVRAVCWGLLIGLAGVVSALSAGFAAEQAGAPFGWTALALLAGWSLAGPVRRLADRIIYPGGDVAAADLARWRQDLSEADDETHVTAKAEALLRHHLGLPADAGLRELDHAPPGPRRVAEVMAGLVDQAKADVSRRRAFAERRRLAELGALAATVAHDLRNPMNIIAMAVADSPPDIRAEVKAQVARMEALVRDLLDYAKPWRVEAVEVDLATVLTEAGISVDCEIPAGLTLRADPGRLRQALANLLDNARAAGGRVLVAAEQRFDAVLIHVCDDGPGIPEDIRAALFQPFVSRSPGGTGLGLAIVAKVMAAHGGSVVLGTRPGWLTCFTLRFPS